MEKVEREKRDLEARLGATPPPSPNDRNSPAFLNSRIMQLSEQVILLKKQLEQTDAQSKSLTYIALSTLLGNGLLQAHFGIFNYHFITSLCLP